MTGRLLALYRDAYRGLSREVWLLSLVTLVQRSGTMVLPFLALYVTTQKGLTPGEAGTVLSVWGVGGLIGAELGGRLSDRLGPIAAQQISLVLAGAGFLALGWASLSAIYVAVFAASCAAESFRPPNGAALAELSGPGDHFRTFALRRLAINVGMTFGPAIGGFLATVDYRWLFVGNATSCWGAAVLLFFAFPRGLKAPAPEPGAPPPPGAARDEDRSPFRDRGFLELLVLVLLLTILFFQLFGPVPVYLKRDLGLSERAIGLTMAVNTLLIIAFEMPLVQAVKDRSPYRVIGWGGLFVGLGLSLYGPATGFGGVALAVAVLTIGEMLTFPLLEGTVAARASARRRGRYIGLYQVTVAGAMILAPLLGLGLYEAAGPNALWIATGVTGVVLLAGFELLARRR